MSTLLEFAERVEELLADTKHEPHWDAQQADPYMTEVELRHKQYTELVTQLGEEAIHPRVKLLSGYFPNAYLATDNPTGHCDCWFCYCERFPSTTQLSFSIGHDVRFEIVAVCYHASMMPQFITLLEHDRLTLPINDIGANLVIPWVETRILEFLDSYLQIDRGNDNFEDTVASDPVCGMRIGKASAAAIDEYLGHPYYFCSAECRESFVQNPASYATVITI